MTASDLSRFAPPANLPLPRPGDHLVKFFEDDAHLVDLIDEFVTTSWNRGQSAVLVLTADHQQALESRWSNRGLDLSALRATHRLLAANADELLNRILINGWPSITAFRQYVVPLLVLSGRNSRGTVAVGEMVAILARRAQFAAAVRLEEIWNAIGDEHPFALLCAYPMSAFGQSQNATALAAVCATHTHVLPAESYSAITNEAERLTEITLLQQKAGALDDEKRQRSDVEQELARRDMELADFLDNAAEGLQRISADGTILWTNQLLLEMLGYTRKEFVGRDILEFVADREAFEHALARLRGGNSIRDSRQRLRARDGSVREVVMYANGYFENGTFVHARCFIRDITEQVRAERLAQEEARNLAALNRIGSAILAQLDLEKVVQTVTDAATEVSGAKFGAFFYNVQQSGEEAYWLYTLSGASRESFASFPMPRATHVFGPTFHGEGIVMSDDITKDERYGRNAPYHGMPSGHLPVRSYLAAPVVSRNGEVTGGLFFGHPEPGVFTERAARLIEGIAAHAAIAIDNARLYQAAQQQLAERERAEAALREADRRKNEFLAMLGHELRNPLAPIRNVTELLRRRDNDDPTQRQLFSILDRQVQQMTRLLDDLLDVSRITRGKIQMHRELLLLDDVVTNALETSGPQVRQYAHRLHVARHSRSLAIRGDQMRLVQMLSNILNNAARYTPNGGDIWVTVQEEPGWAVISVRDSGIGIDPEVLPRIFELFEQADQALARSQGGLGIGLTLVRKIAELHDGTVEAHSGGAGSGSEFVIRLPIAVHVEHDTHDLSAPPAAMHRATVLVVDDNADALESIGIVLRSSGHVVLTARDGREALDVATRETLDAIVLDIGLPEMSGYEVAQELRARGVNAQLIALTAYAQPDDRARAFEAGFDAHLAKPADPTVLETLISTRNMQHTT